MNAALEGSPLAPPVLRVHGRWLEAARCCLERGEPLVLITVARALGSTPRDAGARMWVDAGGAHATIGGGHLELQAIETARAMLADARAPRAQMRHYALGPSLGQCCGGAVWLAFERLGPQDRAWCDALHAALASGAGGRRTRRILVARASTAATITATASASGSAIAMASDAAMASARPGFAGAPSSDVRVEAVPGSGGAQPDAQWLEGEALLVDFTPASAPVVVVCGAGHVGKAIVRVLAELPVGIVWLDPRQQEWPAQLPDNVRCVDGDADDVVDLPDDAYWLVLTHSHALDLEIIERVLRYKSFRYLGLIGSDTKRAKFRARLLRKFPAELVDRITCPIGIVETSSKLPGVIAVSVAAQIAGLLERDCVAAKHAGARPANFA